MVVAEQSFLGCLQPKKSHKAARQMLPNVLKIHATNIYLSVIEKVV